MQNVRLGKDNLTPTQRRSLMRITQNYKKKNTEPQGNLKRDIYYNKQK